jgi:hypothetical protein
MALTVYRYLQLNKMGGILITLIQMYFERNLVIKVVNSEKIPNFHEH